MDWDDEYEFGYGKTEGSTHESLAETDKGSLDNRFDPTDITNLASAYFFLSDDAQNEISGKNLKK